MLYNIIKQYSDWTLDIRLFKIKNNLKWQYRKLYIHKKHYFCTIASGKGEGIISSHIISRYHEIVVQSHFFLKYNCIIVQNIFNYNYSELPNIYYAQKRTLSMS